MRNYRKSLMLGCVIGASLAFSSASYAATFTFSGMAGGAQQNASATVTAGAGTLDVTVTNLIVNPGAVIQNISDFTVMVAGTPITGVTSPVTPTATYVNVAANGTASAGTAPS